MFQKKQKPDAIRMLIIQCEQAEIAISHLVKYMVSPDPALADSIDKTEKFADKEQAVLSEYVENTFITPVSRHYLFNLSRVIDDLTDAVMDLKDFLVFFDYAPRTMDVEMARLSAESIHFLTDALRKWDSKDSDEFWESVRKIRKNENQVKRMYWEDIRQIVQNSSLQEVITSREFCRDLNELARKIEKAADRLGDLKIKSIK